MFPLRLVFEEYGQVNRGYQDNIMRQIYVDLCAAISSILRSMLDDPREVGYTGALTWGSIA